MREARTLVGCTFPFLACKRQEPFSLQLSIRFACALTCRPVLRNAKCLGDQLDDHSNLLTERRSPHLLAVSPLQAGAIRSGFTSLIQQELPRHGSITAGSSHIYFLSDFGVRIPLARQSPCIS